MKKTKSETGEEINKILIDLHKAYYVIDSCVCQEHLDAAVKYCASLIDTHRSAQKIKNIFPHRKSVCEIFDRDRRHKKAVSGMLLAAFNSIHEKLEEKSESFTPDLSYVKSGSCSEYRINSLLTNIRHWEETRDSDCSEESKIGFI